MSDISSIRPATVRTALRRLVALVLLALTSAAVLAPPAGAGVRPYRLTHAQERIVLDLVDDACGDTWCEGDHAFRFRRFACHTKRGGCRLVVQIASWSDEPLRWQRRSRTIRGYPRFVDMVSTSPNGWRSLRPGFYEAVGEAVRSMAATVPVAATAAAATAALSAPQGVAVLPPGRTLR